MTNNFPNCIGALDEKYIKIMALANCGSLYFSYKGYHSIVLMAIVDIEYKFIYVNIDKSTATSDGGAFARTQFYEKLIRKGLQIPNETALPGTEIKIQYVVVGDDAFCLSENLMKPYSGMQSNGSPERVFNYRLHRARRVADNAFGQFATVFCIFSGCINLEFINSGALVCVHMRNYLRKTGFLEVFTAPSGT